MVDVEMGDAVNKSVRDLRTLSEEIQQQVTTPNPYLSQHTSRACLTPPPPQKNTKDIRHYTLREKLYNWVNSIHVQAILVICILVDLSILIYEQSHPEHGKREAARTKPSGVPR